MTLNIIDRDDITPRMHIDWLRKQGHMHVPTVKLMEKQIDMMEQLFIMAVTGETYPDQLDKIRKYLADCK